MIVTAVMQHLGQLVQGPLPAALRPLLQNFPQLLLKAAHTGGALGNAAALFAQFQYQVQQVSGQPCLQHALLLNAAHSTLTMNTSYK